MWFVYRTNPAISFWDTEAVGDAMARFPFTVCFAYTHDETNHMADVLLPDCTDLEGLQLLRIGGTKYVEQFWDYQGFALRDPAAPPQGEAKDFTWIATELARRTGLLEAYNAAINRGAAGVKLSGANYDFSLDAAKVHDVETIWDATCRAASAELTDGAESQGLDWFREHGFRVKPFPRLQWYLYPKLVERGPALRAALPGAAVPHRQGARTAAARARHHLVGQAARGIRAAAALARSRRRCGKARSRSISTCASPTIRSGSSPRAACSIPGAATSASSSSRRWRTTSPGTAAS